MCVSKSRIPEKMRQELGTPTPFSSSNDMFLAFLEVEYFNQRRILAEQQKHYLAQMNAQAEAAKKAKS
jgi:hypothetical protein